MRLLRSRSRPTSEALNSHEFSYAPRSRSRETSAHHALVLCALLLTLGCGQQAPYSGKTVAELVAMLRDADPAVQIQGAYGLSRLGAEAKEALPALIEALLSSESQVRANAALALSAIGPDAKDAVPSLVLKLTDPEWTVRRHAALALGNVGSEAQAAIPALEQLAKDQDQLVGKAAREALSKIRSQRDQGGSP